MAGNNRPFRAVRFKVPKGIQSLKSECKSRIEFKNLTNDLVILYWVDFQGHARLYAELSPIDREDQGISLFTYVTHPWVAVQGRTQVLLNDKRYFYPPNPAVWEHRKNGWMNARWNKITDRSEDEDDDKDNESENKTKFYEVLIVKPGCRSLKSIALERCCDLFSNSKSFEKLPRILRIELEMCKRKLFWW